MALREDDAADLLDEEDEPVPWLPLIGCNGFIVKGWSHLLSGYTRLGKALALDTLIATGGGWSTMGELHVGDSVFDDNGQPCHVTYVSPVMFDHKCFAITFSDGSVIVADAEHRWSVCGDPYGSYKTPQITETQSLILGDRVEEGEAGRWVATVTSTASVPVRCIQVDSASHLYLAGPTRIPTHNTELITETMYDWLRMGHRILYFTEEPRGLWKQRIQKRASERGIVWPHGLQLVFALGTDPKEMLARIKGGPEPIVFLDTVRTLLQPYNENDNSELARLIVPWIGACRDGDKTSIFVHHDRKAGGEHGRGISGGHALMATCDIAVEVVSVEGSETKRRVHSFARVYQSPDLEYDWDPVEHCIIGAGLVDASGNSISSVQSRILQQVGEEWLLTAEIAQKLGDSKPSNEQLRRALVQLAEQGRVLRDPPIDQDASGRSVKWRWVPPIIKVKY